MLATAVPSFLLSLEILATLLFMLGSSAATFRFLVRRWESHRESLALADWAREHEFRKAQGEASNLPRALDVLATRELEIRVCLVGEGLMLLQVQTAPIRPPGGMPGASGRATWNLLVRRLSTEWLPTGLRPSAANASLLDFYSLSSFPLLGSTERFTLFGTDSIAAARLSQSMTRSLLPPDIGLLLHGHEMVLDFSDRPFDEIEFNRMLSLANQIAQKLPAPK
jgi:hypothetical protein